MRISIAVLDRKKCQPIAQHVAPPQAQMISTGSMESVQKELKWEVEVTGGTPQKLRNLYYHNHDGLKSLELYEAS